MGKGSKPSVDPYFEKQKADARRVAAENIARQEKFEADEKYARLRNLRGRKSLLSGNSLGFKKINLTDDDETNLQTNKNLGS